MSPRKFIDFFKTKTGNFLLFTLLAGIGGCIIYGINVAKKTSQPSSKPIQQASPEKNQPVTIERNGVPFVPPAASPTQSNTSETQNAKTQAHVPPPLPITLYSGDSSDPDLSEDYAPYGRLIPCQTIITIDSAKIETPIIGFVTEDVYHNGKLIIPAGAEVHGKAQTDRSRERIASETKWYIVWRTTDRLNGAELPLNGVALDMERNYTAATWEITDGSAGLRGDLLKTDNLAEIKLFAATFLSAATSGLENTQQSINPVTGGLQQTVLASPKNAALQATSAVINEYAKEIEDSIKKDGFYVRVPAGKQFYLYVMQTIDLENAKRGESKLRDEKPTTTH